MMTLGRSAAVLTLLLLPLAGCGGSGSDDAAQDDKGSSSSSKADTAPTPDAAPADGDTITEDGFSFTAPEGWKPSDAASGTALTLVVDAGDKDGFSDNVNVVKDDTIVGVKGAKLEDAVTSVLKNAKATDVTVKDRITVDGEEAVHVSSIFEQNGVQYRTEQYALSHDDAGYVVTVSFSKDVPDADRDEVSESILATWKWAA